MWLCPCCHLCLCLCPCLRARVCLWMYARQHLCPFFSHVYSGALDCSFLPVCMIALELTCVHVRFWVSASRHTFVPLCCFASYFCANASLFFTYSTLFFSMQHLLRVCVWCNKYHFMQTSMSTLQWDRWSGLELSTNSSLSLAWPEKRSHCCRSWRQCLCIAVAHSMLDCLSTCERRYYMTSRSKPVGRQFDINPSSIHFYTVHVCIHMHAHICWFSMRVSSRVSLIGLRMRIEGRLGGEIYLHWNSDRMCARW